MFKIGILGSDNSHADRFSEILNLREHPSYLPDSGAQVVAIWGQEAERTQQVAKNGKIATIVDQPAAMIGQVDAVFCVTRHGGLHKELVLPYIAAGIPVFVDKPLATDPNDARAIVAAVESAFGFRVLSPEVYFLSSLPSDLRWPDVWVTAAIALVLSLVATLYPSWRASKVNPVEALRYD